MDKWKLNKVMDVSPSPWFPVEQHEIELSSGKIVDDYFLTTLADVAMVLPFTTEGNIVLVKQYKHGQRDILLELPAGFIQEGKSIEASAVAELEEETGIKTTIEKLISLGKVAHSPTKSTQVAYGFLAKDLTFNSVQQFDELEEIELVQHSPQKVLEMVLSGEIWVSDSVSFILKAYHLYPQLFQ